MGCAWHAYGGALSTAEGAARRCLQPVGGRLAVGGARGEVVEQHVALDEVVVGHALAQGGGQAGRAEERIEDAHRPPAMHGYRCKMYMHVTLAGGAHHVRAVKARGRVAARRQRPAGEEAWEGGGRGGGLGGRRIHARAAARGARLSLRPRLGRGPPLDRRRHGCDEAATCRQATGWSTVECSA